MFIGHFGAGFALKPAARKVSLGTLFLSAQFLDLLWPVFLLLGVERVEIDPGNTKLTPLDFVHYPITHSLLGAFCWAVLVGVIYALVRKYKTGAWVCGIAVFSHWVLDLLVHRPDLPLVPGESLRIGLGLWNHPTVEMILEFAIFVVGLWLYLRTTRATDRTGTWALVGLVAFLVAIHIGNIMGPPPPSVEAIGWLGNAQWLFVIWAYWVDRHRTIVNWCGASARTTTSQTPPTGRIHGQTR